MSLLASPVHEHEHPTKIRHVGFFETESGERIAVAYVFDDQTCPEHGHLLITSSGVGLVVNGVTKHGDKAEVCAVLTPSEALLLADRLSRAAQLALEVGEDVADVEREVIRHSAPPRQGCGTAGWASGDDDLIPDDPHLTDLRCPHGAKVCIPIERGTWEVALCPASSTEPACYPQFRSVAVFGAPSPFVLGSQYGGPVKGQDDEIIWNLTLADIGALPDGDES
jgi:hypothetical protein